MFLLVKWYLDVVTDEGAVLIGYAARLRWGRLRFGYASVLHSASGAPPRESATIRGVESPRSDEGTLTWCNSALGVRGEWQGEAPPIRRTLLAAPDGDIRWTCRMPRARATVRWNGGELAGRGYVESLRLTIPPWRLPFSTLRWGRHVSDRHSVVWIDWSGTERRGWVWVDGSEAPLGSFTAAGAPRLEGGRELGLSDSRNIRDRPVLSAVSELLPRFARRLAGPLGRMHEHKLLDRSTLLEADRPLDRGWTLHEVVTW